MTVVAEVVRNGFVESVHHGLVVGLGADGSATVAVGDVTSPILPRSSLKPLQAVGMLRAGLDVPDDELAIVCASHSGEPGHLDVVRRLLARAGLDESALDNTPGMPVNAVARRVLIREGVGPTSLTQNCSGKHAGMLATCVAAGWPTDGYRAFDHPLQVALAATVSELCGEPVAATTVDGCGAPAFAVSPSGLARAFATIAANNAEAAVGRVATAMRTHPWLVGGTGRDVTALMEAVPGIIAKDGAEGVLAAATPDGRSVVVKISDGSSRARMPVLVAALRRLGATGDEAALDELSATPVLGHGERVGEVRVAS